MLEPAVIDTTGHGTAQLGYRTAALPRLALWIRDLAAFIHQL